MKHQLTLIWLLLAIVIVALVIVARSSPWLGRVKPQQINVTPVAPDPRNDKVIVVKGWNENELRKIISDFIKTYENDGYPSYSIEPHKQQETLFRLQFPKDIPPQLFTFLVNYIAYPFDLDTASRSIVVAGKTTLTRGFEGLDEPLIGQKALLYLPENDQDHTVVYLRTLSGITFANSFSELVWRRMSDARLSDEVTQLMDGV